MSDDAAPDLAEIQRRMVWLLQHAGNKAHCRGCGLEIYFVRHNNGRFTPYELDGTIHFVTCPKAKDFKRS